MTGPPPIPRGPVTAPLSSSQADEAGAVRLITRGGYDWTKRFPWIVPKHFVIDGEAVILSWASMVFPISTPCIPVNTTTKCSCVLRRAGAGRRGFTWLAAVHRKANLDRLLARRPDGIFVAPFEQGEIGPDLFRAACRMGLEGLVSKRRDRQGSLHDRST